MRNTVDIAIRGVRDHALLLLGFAGVALVVVVVGRLLGGGSGQPSPVPRDAPAAQPEQLARPVDAQATAGASAAATVQAQAAAQATAAAQAQREVHAAYAAKVSRAAQRYASTMSALRELNAQAAQRPALILTPDWKASTAATLAFLQEAGEAMASAAPVPPDMAPVAQLLHTVDTETKRLADEYARGIESGDAQLLQSAAAGIQRVTALAVQASAELRQLTP